MFRNIIKERILHELLHTFLNNFFPFLLGHKLLNVRILINFFYLFIALFLD